MDTIFYQKHLAHTRSRQAGLSEKLSLILKDKNEIILEIGAGHGHFLTEYALKYTHDFCLGLDILNERVKKSQKRAEKMGSKNICFLKAQAEETIMCLPPSVQFKAIYILFPDPWPKRKHFSRRLIQQSFLDSIVPKMVQGAKLYFRTDHKDYFEWAISVFLSDVRWSVSKNELWPIEVVTRFQEITGNVYQSLVASLL